MDSAWACVAANVVKRASDVYDVYLAGEGGKKRGKDEALEMCSQERFIAAKIHVSGYIYRYVISAFCSSICSFANDITCLPDPVNSVNPSSSWPRLRILRTELSKLLSKFVDCTEPGLLRKMLNTSSSMASTMLSRWI